MRGTAIAGPTVSHPVNPHRQLTMPAHQPGRRHTHTHNASKQGAQWPATGGAGLKTKLLQPVLGAIGQPRHTDNRGAVSAQLPKPEPQLLMDGCSCPRLPDQQMLLTCRQGPQETPPACCFFAQNTAKSDEWSAHTLLGPTKSSTASHHPSMVQEFRRDTRALQPPLPTPSRVGHAQQAKGTCCNLVRGTTDTRPPTHTTQQHAHEHLQAASTIKSPHNKPLLQQDHSCMLRQTPECICLMSCCLPLLPLLAPTAQPLAAAMCRAMLRLHPASCCCCQWCWQQHWLLRPLQLQHPPQDHGTKHLHRTATYSTARHISGSFPGITHHSPFTHEGMTTAAAVLLYMCFPDCYTVTAG
jgi:hypothetical protein